MAAIVLAGGASVRMGQDKANMILPNGRSMLEHILDQLHPLFETIYVSVPPGRRYASEGVSYVEDELVGVGAISGLHACLKMSVDDVNFVIACDMPGVNIKLVEALAKLIEDYDMVLPRLHDQLHPLFGFYRKSCVDIIEANIEAGRRSFHALNEHANSKVVDADSLLEAAAALRSLFNANRPDEFQDFIKDK